ncbi:hypothetical protein MKX01_028970, partial [Papaver californicum]
VMRMVVSTYQAASGAGVAAMKELELQTREAKHISRPYGSFGCFKHRITIRKLYSCGRSRRMRLEEWVTLNERIPIIVDEVTGEPTSKHIFYLAGECRQIVHAFAPLRYKSWTKIPAQEREALIELLEV